MLTNPWRWWRRGRVRDEEIDREIQADLELEAEARREAGASDESARLAARRAFGNTAVVRENTREVWGRGSLERLAQDLRYAGRTFRRNPGFAAVTLLILALGIGANTTIFSIVNGVLLRPLPFREPDRLMMIDEKWLPRFPHFEATPRDFMAWRAESRTFGELSAFQDVALNMTGRDRPERILGARVSANLPTLLGVEPILGRSFTPDEDRDGNNRVILLSHGLWQRAFGADRGAVGGAVSLNGVSHTIVGVMPPGFRFPQDADLWTPMGFTAKELTSGGHFVWAVGRLKPGVTREQAQAEMDLIMPRLQQVWSANVIPLTDHYVGDVRLALTVLLGAAAMVLLIACVNVANLLLARASVRQKEIFLRASLGASRRRIVQQLLTEAMLLSALGGALGLALAVSALALIQKMPLADIPRLDETTLDYRVLAFTLTVSALTGVLFGLSPAIRLSRPNLQDALKTGGRISGAEGRTVIRHALVIGELALALVILSGAGLLLKSFWRLLEVRPGFSPDRVITASISLPATGYQEPYQQNEFVAQLLERLRGRPDVRAVAVSTGLPLSSVEDSGIHFDGRPPGSPITGTAANHYRVTPDYLQAMGIPLVRGRFFVDGDSLGSHPVVLINETMARRFFPDEDPIGKRLDISGPTYLREIVGVVGDVKQEGLRRETPPQVYEPFLQKPARSFNVVVRGGGDDTRMAEALRQEVLAIDRYQPVSEVRSLEHLVARSVARDRFAAILLGLFAVLALVLAAVGIYGVMAYSVTRRTSEIGLRMALGAQPRAILRLVLGQSVGLVLVGLGIGLAASILLTRVMGTLLYEVKPRDPATLLGVSALLLGVALAAAFIPARRAARVDPIVALRSE